MIFLNAIRSEQINTEEDVRAKIVTKLIDALGYPSNCVSMEVPVYYHEGRTRPKPKYADAICYSKKTPKPDREASFSGEYRDCTLFVIEVKKPDEDIVDAVPQAEFYTYWTRAPLYCVTNGKDYRFFASVRNAADRCISATGPDELSSKWTEIYSEFSFRNALAIKEAAINSREQIKPILFEYCLRIVRIHHVDGFKRSLLQNGAEHEISVDALMGEESSFLVYGSPGIGKSELLGRAAARIAQQYLDGHGSRVPITIRARSWCRQYNNLLEGAFHEAALVSPEITIEFLQENPDMFCLVVDGLDEAKRERDLLFDELALFASMESTRLICSSRFEGDSSFIGLKSFELSPLADEQIINYLSTNGFKRPDSVLRKLSKNGRDLLRNPLHLSCLTEYLKRQDVDDIPKNTSIIYAEFIRHMLTSKIDSTADVDVAKICNILGAYALNDLVNQNSPNPLEFFTTDQDKADFHLARERALATGLIMQTDYGLEFSHTVFQEYLAASYLSTQNRKVIEDFCAKNGSNHLLENFFEILCGSIRDAGKQAVVLDYLENNDLRLYMKCLNGRLDFSTSVQDTFSLSDLRRMGEQILVSYVNITNRYLNSAKPYIPFWGTLSHLNSEICVQITYSFHTSVMHIEFDEHSSKEKTVTVRISDDDIGPVIKGSDGVASPILSFKTSSRPGLHVYRLNEVFGGIDCAREIAITAILDDIEGFFANTVPILNEPVGMRAGFVEAALRSTHILTKNASGEDIPISLRSCTATELAETIGNAGNLINVEGTRIPIDVVPIMMELLERGELSYKELIPPEPDNLENFNGWIWDLYKDDTALRWIEVALAECERSYRAYVETFFKEASAYLPGYADGPVMLRVQAEKKDNGPLSPNMIIKVSPYPVQDIDDIRIAFVEDVFPDELVGDGFERRAKEYSRMERALERPGNNFHEYHSDCADVLGKCSYVRHEVRKRVKAELKALFELK